MKAAKIFAFTLSVILIPEIVNCQTGHRDYIEFSLFSTHNKQAEYLTKFGDVAYTNNLKLSGPDLGFSLDYKRRLYDNLFVKAGIGYMDFMVTKIEDKTEAGSTLFTSNGRLINYPSYVFVLYATTKYHYNLLFHFAAEKQFKLLRNLYLFSSVDYFHAYGISQKYFIPGAHAWYRTSNKGKFGDFFNLHFGISREFGKLAIAPALVLPVYKSWNRDVEFKEDLRERESNWFNGIGISVSISYR